MDNSLYKMIFKRKSFHLFRNIGNEKISDEELKDDIFYKEYKKYDECVLDYCIIKSDLDYNGEKSHKNVVIFAMSKWANVLKNKITINLDKMKANKVDTKCFFEISKEDKNKNNKYWYLFLNPPHGCNYSINHILLRVMNSTL